MVERQIGGGNVDPPAAHIIDQDVDLTTFLKRLTTSAFGLGGETHVGDDRRRGLSATLDLPRGLGETGLIAADENAVGAGFGDGKRHLASQPPAAAGDEEPFAVEAKAIEDSSQNDEILMTNV